MTRPHEADDASETRYTPPPVATPPVVTPPAGPPEAAPSGGHPPHDGQPPWGPGPQGGQPSPFPTQQAHPGPAPETGGYLPYPDTGRDQAEYGGRGPQQARPGGPDVPQGEPSGTRTLWIIAYVLAVIGLLVPFVGFGAIGCGAVAWRRGSRHGRTATLVAIAATIIGWIVGVLIITS
ncbi:DUF4190 domain-containing protein [Frankia sp. AiPs1]|uniref:CPP1-like family protein n=1 Tax=Frankia sp. AiPa1 TaxID=573492 RepID=UPI00202B38A4|nr:CPP1-like family protein [Frankia sp. AiPa1]MCL9760144.1 CPP1-like family protein [Frankia sp. AiPa1]